MKPQDLTENIKRLEANRNYSAKLSWKRKETIELRRQIKEFIENNFNIEMPSNFSLFKRMTQSHDIFNSIAENCGELVRTFYNLGNFGESIGSLFENSSGQKEVFTNAHLFSKNRIDPVWNWKKSKLIRSVYYKFLQETDIHEHYTPVHITLTLPHKDGLYNGKKFYAKELIEAFNLMRKQDWWKHYVYAGEYGLEVTGGHNGLHIHAHSLAFLHTSHLKKFRNHLKEAWEEMTGATKVWVESLYIYKKGDNGQYITEMKDSDKLETFEEPDGTYTSVPEGKVIIRKKFYIQGEQKRINETIKDPVECKTAILELYTRAILECIKYHFKNDSLKLPDGNFNIFLINEILQNTKGKRLYSRYGKFYKEPALCFNRFDSDDEVFLSEANSETVINPITLQEVPIEETELVIFKPEHISYSGKTAIKPNTPLYEMNNTFEHMTGKNVKQLLRILIDEKFKKHNKPIKVDCIDKSKGQQT